MNVERVEAIAKAVLYEGYILYPYRASNVKNRQRWTFGALFPRDWTKAHEDDFSQMETQVLVRGTPDAKFEAHLRFLHVVRREVGELETPVAALPADHEAAMNEPALKMVPSLQVGGELFVTWDEAIEREVFPPARTVGELAQRPRQFPFSFAGERKLEPLKAPGGAMVGALLRVSRTISGVVSLGAEQIEKGVFRVSVRVRNMTRLDPAAELTREEAQLSAFVSTHTILGVEGGDFISLLDPPSDLEQAAASCANVGTWPVLAGDEGETDTMLSSPIILYDYPETAPESPGDLYDSSEIDEILTLRILAMTDGEKREMAQVDARARALLDRTEALTPEQLDKLHGVFRKQNPDRQSGRRPELAFIRANGAMLRVGDRVRLHPKPGADAMDLMLKDQAAIIEAIERDFEGCVHVAVVLEEDPGRELGLQRMPGHRFFFSPDEIVAIAEEAPS